MSLKTKVNRNNVFIIVIKNVSKFMMYKCFSVVSLRMSARVYAYLHLKYVFLLFLIFKNKIENWEFDSF